MKNSGIYIIRNKIDSRVYVGSSKNLKRRLERHFSELRMNKHCNKYLQRFVNKYSINNVYYEILENCEVSFLLEKEIYYVSKYNSLINNNGFNLMYPDRTFLSKKIKENISKCLKNNPKNKKINVIDINKNIIFTGIVSDAVTKYALDCSSIYKILNGKRKMHKKLTFELI